MRFDEQFASYARQTNDALRDCLRYPGVRLQAAVVDAMRYSLLDAGKRLRAALVLEFARLASAPREGATALACAIEMLHAYSLIHDDLPCMDNDDFRRGKPSCHKEFGESTALLAGDALLTLAFETAAGAPLLTDLQRVEAVCTLSKAGGVCGMIGGQVIDLACEGNTVDEATLDTLCTLKTGALLRAAARLGCLAGKADKRCMMPRTVTRRPWDLHFRLRTIFLMSLAMRIRSANRLEATRRIIRRRMRRCLALRARKRARLR